jgi:formate dehydrogenase accessory protein FdhD
MTKGGPTETGSVRHVARRLGSAGAAASREEVVDEDVAEEVAVALVYNGVSHAVMMVTPCDLEDFARGFSLSERIVERPSEIFDIEVEPVQMTAGGKGIEVRLRIAGARMASLQQRRRSMAGRTGCGLCGVDSLEAALRPVATVAAPRPVSAAAIRRAMADLPAHQPINQVNGATHAAGWADAAGALVAVREDVGRHNALDKLLGALAAKGALPEQGGEAGGFVVVTSRCSYEMVQKAAAAGASAIAAVSAPTSLAIETAKVANVALVAFVRDERLTVYALPERIVA